MSKRIWFATFLFIVSFAIFAFVMMSFVETTHSYDDSKEHLILWTLAGVVIFVFSCRKFEEEREERDFEQSEKAKLREGQRREPKVRVKVHVRSCHASVSARLLAKTKELEEWLANIGIAPDEDLEERNIWDFGFRTRSFAVAFKMDPQRAVELLFGYDYERVSKTHPELYRQLMLAPKSAEPIDIENIVLGVIMSDPSIDPILAPERSTA